MKDKLVKTHHTKAYYYFKKISITCSCIFGACLTVAVPISIMSIIRQNDVNTIKVEEEGEKEDTKTSTLETVE